MTLPEPYKYHKKRTRSAEHPTARVRPNVEEEGLTGFVQDLEASDLEERFARALTKHEVTFEFREFFFAPVRNIPGAREADFMVYFDHGIQPVQIDGEFAHKSAEQKASDRATDAIMNDYLQRYGMLPVLRVPDGILYQSDALDSQESANLLVEELTR